MLFKAEKAVWTKSYEKLKDRDFFVGTFIKDPEVVTYSVESLKHVRKYADPRIDLVINVAYATDPYGNRHFLFFLRGVTVEYLKVRPYGTRLEKANVNDLKKAFEIP